MVPNTIANPQAAKLHFPHSIPSAVKDAIISFKPPTNRTFATFDPKKKNPSITIWYGVRLEEVREEGKPDLVAENKKRTQYWACLANNECRNDRTMIKISSEQTTGATSHLRDMHGIHSQAYAANNKR